MNVQFNITPFQKTEYFQSYRTPYERKVAAKQQAVVQETKKNQVRTFTHFN